MRGLKGKNVIVTGGASGIGQAISLRLGEEGCNVGIFDLNGDGANGVAEKIRAAGGTANGYACDISDYSVVESMVGAFESDCGPVDGLVNNAGWDKSMPFLDTDLELWHKVVAINLYGPLNLCHVVLKGMAERGGGRMCASVTGLPALRSALLRWTRGCQFEDAAHHTLSACPPF